MSLPNHIFVKMIQHVDVEARSPTHRPITAACRVYTKKVEHEMANVELICHPEIASAKGSFILADFLFLFLRSKLLSCGNYN